MIKMYVEFPQYTEEKTVEELEKEIEIEKEKSKQLKDWLPID